MLHSVYDATHGQNYSYILVLAFLYHFCRGTGTSDFLLKNKLIISSLVRDVQSY